MPSKTFPWRTIKTENPKPSPSASSRRGVVRFKFSKKLSKENYDLWRALSENQHPAFPGLISRKSTKPKAASGNGSGFVSVNQTHTSTPVCGFHLSRFVGQGRNHSCRFIFQQFRGGNFSNDP